MENLEKSRHFKIVISRPGKVLEKKNYSKSFGKVLEVLLYLYVHLTQLD